MSAHDRKVIHNLLKSYQGIVTSSHGREPDRYVVVEVEGASNTAVPDAPDGRSGGRGRGERGGSRGRGGPQRGGKPQGDKQGGKRRDLYGKQPAVQVSRSDVPEEEEFRETPIEEGASRLPVYRERPDDDSHLDPARPMVDELE
jgi:hypothetical protein